MLIINQNIDSIINLDRVKEISLFEPFENDTETWIFADDIQLGAYKDSIRAKSILHDLLLSYNSCNTFVAGFVQNDYYYMPKE